MNNIVNRLREMRNFRTSDERRIELAAADALERLTAENAALRKDAERYRWLRTQHANILLGQVHVAGIGALTSTGLDAAIDAAMEQSHDK